MHLAEREGFEPPDPCRSTVFKTAAIDHSAISPGAKLNKFYNLTNKNVRASPDSQSKTGILAIFLDCSLQREYLCI